MTGDKLWKVSISTLNCGRAFPFREEKHKQDVLRELMTSTDSNPQDIYVLGVQELVRIWEGVGKLRMETCLLDLSTAALEVLRQLFPDIQYKKLGYSYVGATAVLVFCKDTIECYDSLSTTSNCGIFGSTLKGGTAYTFKLSQEGQEVQTFTFICCHLNAKEGRENKRARIDDFDRIMSQCNRVLDEAGFRKGHIFFFGDLNFRVTDTNVAPQDPNKWEETLWRSEELNRLKHKGIILRGFKEGRINFPPTYKYKLQSESTYNSKRIPSWCDRILYKKYHSAHNIGSCKYESVRRSRTLQFTDHQAVNLVIEVPEITHDTIHDLELVRILEPLDATLGYLTDKILAYEWMRGPAIYIIGLIVVLWLLYRLF
ncbi:Phosphatidylinositol 4,5-bisphosphate 5-phosphatase INP54 [Nakaseomyces bracarensis]|uniref:Phosphatidylinositol 4,5-bisphosphate 5-phosphatase INP54 n=1 Tax=Nakaseomyces bracarensis TaxID=273131 RepID=A0ABR4NQ79_9SACH